jgi:hypothetical protein
VAATVFSAKPSTYALLWKAPKYEVGFKSGRKVTLDTSLSHQELVTLLDDALQQQPTEPKTKAESRDEILDYFGARYSTAGEQGVAAWSMTVIPPAVLLALGIALVWILRGFRRSPA